MKDAGAEGGQASLPGRMGVQTSVAAAANIHWRIYVTGVSCQGTNEEPGLGLVLICIEAFIL